MSAATVPPTTHPRPPRTLLHALPTTPTAAEIAAVVEALVADALPRRHPRMSLGATLRHAALPVALRDRIREAALDALESHTSVGSSAPPPRAGLAGMGRWLNTREAAAALAVTERTLLDRLVEPHHRRLLGWPWWDGHAWHIAPTAVDPERRAAFLAGLPDVEPQSDLLPPWCTRGRPA